MSLPITAAIGPQTIANYLKKHGIKILKVSPIEQDADGEIQLENDYHVQVGYGYASLNKWNEKEQSLLSGAVRYDAADILKDIKAKT